METKTVITESWVGLIEDGLDLILFVFALAYVVAANDFGIRLSDETLAYVATTGAGARLIARRIVARIIALRMTNSIIEVDSVSKASVSIEKNGPES